MISVFFSIFSFFSIVNEPTNTDGQGASGALTTDSYDIRSKQQKL